MNRSSIPAVQHAVCASAWIRVRRVLILALAATLFFFLYQQHRFRGLSDPEAMEYAQLGRALAEGRGYRTRLMRPLAMSTMAQRQPGMPVTGELPEIIRPPLYPVALAVAFRWLRPDFQVPARGRLFAPETRVVIPLGWFSTLATAILLFLVADHLFDRRIASLAPVVYLLSRTVLQRSISGLPDPFASLLGAAALAIALLGATHRDSDVAVGLGRAVAATLAAGALAGLAVLCQYSLILLAPAPLMVCVLAAPARRRSLLLGLFTLALAAVVTPWMVRNLMVSGQPLGLAHLEWLRGSTAFPGDRLDRSLTLNLDALNLGVLLRRQWWEGLSTAGWATRWCLGGESILPALALPALLLPGFLHGGRRLRWPLLAAAIAMLTIDPLLAAQAPGRLLYPLLPWIMLLGCATLIERLDEAAISWPMIRSGICAIVLLMHAAPTVADLLKPREPLPYPPVYPPFVAAACALIDDNELMVSDLPWATAWYGNQRTLWLPNTLADFYRVNDTHQSVASLYLTTQTGSRAYVGDLLDGPHQDWRLLIDGRIPEGFPLSDGLRLPPGGRDQLVLIAPGRFAESPPAE